MVIVQPVSIPVHDHGFVFLKIDRLDECVVHEPVNKQRLLKTVSFEFHRAFKIIPVDDGINTSMNFNFADFCFRAVRHRMPAAREIHFHFPRQRFDSSVTRNEKVSFKVRHIFPSLAGNVFNIQVSIR